MRARRNFSVRVLALVATFGVMAPGVGAAAPPEPVADVPWVGSGGAEATRVGDRAVVGSSGLPGSGIVSAVDAGGAEALQVILEVRGTESSMDQLVQLVVSDPHGDTEVASAPVPLASYWQRVGVTAPVSGGPLNVSLTELGDWHAGDGYTARLASVRAAAVTVTSTSGRQFLVNGTPTTIKGYNYHAGPVGTTVGWTGANLAGWQSNPAQCQTDAQLMRAAGINTLRIHYRDVYNAQVVQCMDAFAANGVGLFWLVNGPAGVQNGEEEYLEVFWFTLSNTVEAVKNHPATLGYVIGNEVSAHDLSLTPEWFRTLDELARRTKERDPLHVTTTALTSSQFNYLTPSRSPNLDMWGVNYYSRQNGYHSTLWSDMQTRTTKPVWIPEFGTDRYRCPAHTPGFGLQFVFDPLSCPLPASGQQDQVQADWNALAWSQIAANLSADDPSNPVAGATLFYWSDWWSFACCAFNQVGSDFHHEVASRRDDWITSVTPPGDGAFNLEWGGSTHALGLTQNGPRVTTATYDRMASLFLGTPAPTITTPVASAVGPCGANLSWSTSVPTSYRIDYSNEKNVIVAGSIVQDNYLADRVKSSATLDTTWTVRVTGLSRGEANRIYVRGFDANGRVVSAPPITVTTPADGPGAECALP